MLAEPCPSPRELFDAEWPAIERVLAWVARRHALDPDEAADFSAHATLKLMEDDYAILRKFRGGSRLSTYLTTVLHRLFLDYRIERWGKWRPSAQARRAGLTGVRLDRLISCEGFTAAEAVEILRSNDRVPESAAELLELARSLPVRAARRALPEESLRDREAEGATDQRCLEGERRRALRSLCRALRGAVEALPAEDRLALRLRFEEGMSIAEIAGSLHLPAKPLYRRLARRLSELRTGLLAAGFDRGEVERALGWDGTTSPRRAGAGVRARAGARTTPKAVAAVAAGAFP